MGYYGYAGKILYIDLSSGEIRHEPLDMDMAKKFGGGAGVNYRLAWELIKPKEHALSPNSPLILGVGPLVGSMCPGANKVFLSMKFAHSASRTEVKQPIDTSTAGTRRFGAMLKHAGYDHVVITGKAKKPCYIKIIDDDVEICDASDLWGKADIYETSDELINRYNVGSCPPGVWAIGRAGENLVMSSLAFVDKHGSMGRNVGASLGAKNLKAVVCSGSKGVRVADPGRFMKLAWERTQFIMSHPMIREPWAPGGGGIPSEGLPDNVYEKIQVGRIACMCCYGPESDYCHVKDGRFKGTLMQSAIFAIPRRYAFAFKLKDYGEAIKLNDVLNRWGLDYWGFYRMTQWLMHLYQEGVISSKDIGGLKLEPGNYDAVAQLAEMMVNRQGIGEAMAQGPFELMDKLGIDATEDVQYGPGMVKGMTTWGDAREVNLTPGTLAAVVRPRPKHRHQGTHYAPGPDLFKDTYWPGGSRSFYDIKRDFEQTMAPTVAEVERVFGEKSFNTGRLEKHAGDTVSVCNCLSICDISPYTKWDPMRNIPVLAQFYSAATGIEVMPQELKKIGERAMNIERLLNIREGFTRGDDAFPKEWLLNTEKPYVRAPSSHYTQGGERYLTDFMGNRLSRNDLEKMLDDYYDERGWDKKTGIPMAEKLTELGLEEFAVIPPVQH